MSQVYKITDEEINQTILHSPYSLADSPAKAGLKAMQIKKYFYEFIRFFAGKINIHLDDIGEGFDNVDLLLEEINQKILDLEASDLSIGDAIKSNIKAHNISTGAHLDIRNETVSKLSAHNVSTTAHGDIRSYLKELRDKLNVAYTLASGKQMVYPCDTALDAIIKSATEDINVGDLLLVRDESEVDFTVFEKGVSQAQQDDIAVDYTALVNGELTFEAGKMYFFKGKRLLASRGNLETGLLAKQDDLDELENLVLANAEAIGEKLTELENILSLKQNNQETVDNTSEVVTLETDHEYNLGLRTSVIIEVESTKINSIINFRSGTTPTSFDAPSDIIFTGDDTLNGRLYPVSNRLYEINIKNVMGALVARVGASDYEVIE